MNPDMLALGMTKHDAATSSIYEIKNDSQINTKNLILA
jgi:hypothetical protein